MIMIALFEAFPAARCLSKVASPQPVELLSEESCDSQTELSVKPIILTSGMGPQVCIVRLYLVRELMLNCPSNPSSLPQHGASGV